MNYRPYGDVPCHVYRFFAITGRILYIGMADDVVERAEQHAASADWWNEVVRCSVTSYPTRHDTAIAEQKAIYVEEPVFNVQRDGKLRKLQCAQPIGYHDNFPLEILGQQIAYSARSIVTVRKIYRFDKPRTTPTAKSDMIYDVVDGHQLVTLGDAADQLQKTVGALHKHRQRDSQFPPTRGRRGQQDLYSFKELISWNEYRKSHK